MNGAAVTGAAAAPAPRGDRLLLRGLLLLLAFAAAATPVRNYDYWWHLASGRLILDQGRVPRADPFSFTAPGAPWIDHEWLFQVAAGLVHAGPGPSALLALKIAAILGLSLLLAGRLERQGLSPGAACLVLVPALLGAAFRLDVRPELLTLLLAPLVIELVLRARESGRAGPLAAIPVVVAIWANLHVGVVAAPALLFAGAAGTFLSLRLSGAGKGPERRFARRLTFTALAAAAAVGLNPYGLTLYLVPPRLARLLSELPSPNLEWAAPSPVRFPVFFLSLAGLVLLLILRPRRADPVAAPAALLAGALALLHLRNIGLFSLLLPFAAGGPLAALGAELAARRRARAAAGPARVRAGFVVPAILLALALPLLAALPPGLAFGTGIAPGNEPRAAVDFLEREGLGERLFNDVRFGGYLIWRRFPEHRVFIDGRNEVYPELLREIFARLGDPPAFQALLERHGIDAALLRYPPHLEKIALPEPAGGRRVVVERAFSAIHFPRDKWALVYWDDEAMIVVRRSPATEAAIGRLEYRHLHPDDWRHQRALVRSGRLAAAALLDEIGRKLAEDPGCRRARMLYEIHSAPLETRRRAAAPSGGGV